MTDDADDGLERRDYKPGDVIFKQGEAGSDAFIVESGRVEISRGDASAEMVLGLVKPGDLIGEMALLDSSPRMATARARSNATCVVIPKRVFDRMLKDGNPILVTVLRTLLRRLRSETASKVNSTL